MRLHGTGWGCRWHAVFLGLFVLGTLAGAQALAKGPPSNADFYLDIEEVGLVYTDTIELALDIRTIGDGWTDDDGVEWVLRRCFDAADWTYYFDVVLPRFPENSTEYVVELNAGADGFNFDGVHYEEGLWATATATGRTRNEWDWFYWGNRRYKWQRTIATWDLLEGYFLP